jgi:microcystin-dependent protein
MKNQIIIILIAILSLSGINEIQAQEAYIGDIKIVAFNFAPRNWALCDGQLLPINQNQSLYSILGTTYGGDGRTTFALPDLRGRVPVHEGQGPGLSPRTLGSGGGSETNSLQIANLPAHSHAVSIGSAEEGTTEDPNGNFVAGNGTLSFSPTSDGTMALPTVSNTGSNQSVNNMQPYRTVNYIICLQGLFPSRN